MKAKVAVLIVSIVLVSALVLDLTRRSGVEVSEVEQPVWCSVASRSKPSVGYLQRFLFFIKDDRYSGPRGEEWRITWNVTVASWESKSLLGTFYFTIFRTPSEFTDPPILVVDLDDEDTKYYRQTFGRVVSMATGAYSIVVNWGSTVEGWRIIVHELVPRGTCTSPWREDYEYGS